MKIWSNTNTLDGYIDDLDTKASKSEATIALVGGKAIDIGEFPHLKGIFKTGVGTDNLPFEAAKARGIEIRLPSAKTNDWIFEETANFACYLALRMIYDHAGVLETWTKLPRTATRNKTLLILGLGNIGRRVQSKMAMFCRVTTFDAATDPAEKLPALMAEADCISLHMPLIDATRSFINAERLAWMKPGAALINTARGPVVDEAALGTAIASGHVRAAFDVFWKEPYQGELRQLPNDQFLMTPHIASTCDEFLSGCAVDFREFCHEVG
jgi:phosphoglycerate dehydrogenase-like enzyme